MFVFVLQTRRASFALGHLLWTLANDAIDYMTFKSHAVQLEAVGKQDSAIHDQMMV